ncbi:30S ribosomal protein S21 [bacterium]|nr:30S ribosomal protein S21 [bacterium]MDB0072690.1 30S ribosomal protein S21 [bacterium]MDB4351855.1 30S ribosomal protein S21 [Porticoccaceae bacterium]|tara:strand:- start:788 stop:982 length:195 start_codon:yes stop_codon:yes gene_type:complete
MLIIKVDKRKGIEKALREYKSKVIKTRQSKEINKRKEFVKPSVIKRQELNKAKYVEKKFKSDNN